MTSDDESITKAEPVPPHETTPSPVEVSVAMPRYFGVTPPTFLFGVATATLALAIVFAVLAHWIAALILAIAVLVETALFVGVARRKPDTAVANVSARSLQRARERAAWLVHATSVRTEAGRRITPLRRELLELSERRERLLRDLGAAVYDGADDAAPRVRNELERLDRERRQKEEEMRAIEAAAQERLHEGRMRVQQTVVKPPGDER